jgi:hypothetical protein
VPVALGHLACLDDHVAPGVHDWADDRLADLQGPCGRISEAAADGPADPLGTDKSGAHTRDYGHARIEDFHTCSFPSTERSEPTARPVWAVHHFFTEPPYLDNKIHICRDEALLGRSRSVEERRGERVSLIEQILMLVWGVAPSSRRSPRVIVER